MDELNTIRAAIVQLMAAHQQRPFGILREAGIQAELRRLIVESLDRPTTAATLVNLDGTPAPNLQVDTDRVQLEMKIGSAPLAHENLEKVLRARTDLVLLRNEIVELRRAPNGYYDIVAAIEPQFVQVAVEIKASPSHALQQKIGYARDIERLLRLKQRHAIEGFFIILDKSRLLHVEKPAQHQYLLINWAAPLDAAVVSLGDIVYQLHPQAVREGTWQDILISPVPPLSNTPCVEVWANVHTDEAPGRWFAYCSETT